MTSAGCAWLVRTDPNETAALTNGPGSASLGGGGAEAAALAEAVAEGAAEAGGAALGEAWAAEAEGVTGALSKIFAGLVETVDATGLTSPAAGVEADGASATDGATGGSVFTGGEAATGVGIGVGATSVIPGSGAGDRRKTMTPAPATSTTATKRNAAYGVLDFCGAVSSSSTARCRGTGAATTSSSGAGYSSGVEYNGCRAPSCFTLLWGRLRGVSSSASSRPELQSPSASAGPDASSAARNAARISRAEP